MAWPADKVKPCGTIAALRRHQRRGERACTACLQAGARAASDRTAGDGRLFAFDPRPFRNGIPETPGYSWRARRYPWAERVLFAAEAVHGSPDEYEVTA